MELFRLLRSSISGEKLTDREKESLTPEQLLRLFKIAGKHDLAHLLALAVKQNDLPLPSDMKPEPYLLKAVYRYEQLRYEYEILCGILEKAEIPFLPLKGSVIRKYYPEPWMRTSCDIDILIHEEDAERAIAALVEEHGCTYQGKSSHDVSLYTASNVHLELHYHLIEEGRANSANDVLATVWENAILREGCSFFYEMSDEMFYFYHIAHMAKHFEEGGCGIRPFIDLLILDRIPGVDAEKRDELLEKGSLLKFANAARRLSRIWFSDEEHDLVSQQMEDYILRGGVYGSNENRITVQQQKKGGRMRYALSKIFLPYDVIRFHYPVLQKHRWLTPLMEVRRWGKLIFCGHAKRTLHELKYNQTISEDKATATRNLMEHIGL